MVTLAHIGFGRKNASPIGRGFFDFLFSKSHPRNRNEVTRQRRTAPIAPYTISCLFAELPEAVAAAAEAVVDSLHEEVCAATERAQSLRKLTFAQVAVDLPHHSDLLLKS